MKAIHFILRKFAGLFLRAANLFVKFAYKVYSPQQTISETNKKQWQQIDGDNSLRLKYELNHSSVVFDVGGFKGDWALEIYARYSCNIFVFEPVKNFTAILESRFLKNNSIKIFKYGLGAKNEKMNIAVMSESSSTERAAKNGIEGKTEQIEIVSFTDFVNQNNITKIDLIKINIEGGEYDLLNQIINSGYIKNISNIQVQFHDFVSDAENKMSVIKKKLALTHELTYEYIFVWENWKLKI
jgi:FkbM family methyltransferase